jgi:hypothetical protein
MGTQSNGAKAARPLPAEPPKEISWAAFLLEKAMRTLIVGLKRNQERYTGLWNVARGKHPKVAGIFASVVLLSLLFGCGGGGGGGATEGLNTTSSLTSGTSEEAKATLTWEAPTTDVEGNPAVGLAGFKVYVGTTTPISKGNSLGIDVGNTITYVVEALGAGTYYFAISAYDSLGNESALSNEVTKVISTI